MLEIHLRKPWFTYSACESFTKNKENIIKLKETGNSSNNYQKELDKGCFQHDMAYGGFKNLNRRIAAEKVLCDKAFDIAEIPKYNIYQSWIAPVVYGFFDKKTQVVLFKNKLCKMKNSLKN